MQFADFDRAREDPRAEAERLAAAGHLSPPEAESLDIRKIRRFFQSGLYARMRRSPRCRREVHFTVGLPAGALLPDASLPEGCTEESVVVQGIADCVFEENGTLILVDYKTDQADSPRELADRYARQLQVYAFALPQATGLPVGECLLYSFALGEAVPLPLPATQGAAFQDFFPRKD